MRLTVSTVAIGGLLITQAVEAQRVSYGSVLGVTRPNLTFESETVYTPDYASRTGLAVGGSLGFHLDDVWSVRTELSLVGKGTSGETADFVMRSIYVEAPVFIRLETPSSRNGLLLSLMAGGAVAWELACGGRTTPAFPGGPRPPPVPLDCGRQRSDSFDAATVLGAGVGWRREGGREWRIEARYTHGLSDIGTTWEPIRVFNRTLSVLLLVERRWRRE